MTEMRADLITPIAPTDDFVVDCARVSYNKKADQYTPEQNQKLIRYLARHGHWSPFAHPRICFDIDVRSMDLFRRTANLAGFSWHGRSVSGSLYAWAENLRHLAPWEADAVACDLHRMFPVAAQALGIPPVAVLLKSCITRPTSYETHYETFRIRAPIFVARQLDKHQVHLVKNEVSRRYVSSEPELWWPERWHYAPEHSKQGASDNEFIDSNEELFYAKASAHGAVNAYQALIKEGIAPEEARMMLPQNMMTEWAWTGSLNAFKRVCEQRLQSDAQAATQVLVRQINAALANKHGSAWRSAAPHHSLSK